MNFLSALLFGLLLVSCHGEIQKDSEDSLQDEPISKELDVIRQPRSENTLQQQNRPILELVLGVLDTFHSSAQSEIRRIKTRRARQNQQLTQQQQTKVNHESTSSSSTSTEAYEKKTTAGKKRFNSKS